MEKAAQTVPSDRQWPCLRPHPWHKPCPAVAGLKSREAALLGAPLGFSGRGGDSLAPEYHLKLRKGLMKLYPKLPVTQEGDFKCSCRLNLNCLKGYCVQLRKGGAPGRKRPK